jgi:hypothetical protein
VSSKDIGLELNAEKTEYIFMSREENAGQYHNIQVGNKSFERVKEFKYLGTKLTDQSTIHEEMKSILQSGCACYHSVQNRLYSSLLTKNVKTEIYRTFIFHVLYGCETWFLTLIEEHMVRLFENKVLRKLCGPEVEEVTGRGVNCIMRSFMICTPHEILFE